ncbi:ABC transporter ATP-binding protein [Anoxybacillus sp. LAT_35]|uniref:ABC transporter ATP-binding protein n=1 Tax=unclassified Anoxybacillus TaxID=2639704 RepID=UPI001EDAEC7E|nr:MULTISPECIES: ABC transporter ATP-binding protein [unclassified Anoxybacillus]MCG5025586.1 ABC transporter ATP-binding protein [Anoxybacillus flavithermus]MCG6196549.1 ABC transporter ATP-binding protein [Anoxybacillus sp. LAT_38]MCG3083953.1 ABC transporter ATP-binding protein [Anoxybacillus sp. LAT27]MCG6172298.1 ABC transporter ATP-binding protein [Anoxybacillus sp. LAT_11]MCG6175509.1 ABC transporter ATP-binding protein [Anoxybacillus sp. LAT_31]
MDDIILETNGLTIVFGGHVAVDNVSVKIQRNQLKSIIGPNGAGKTTFFNMLSGQLKPTKGSVFFDGKDITSLSPAERTRLGIGRSFQITNVFPNLTCYENVRLAVQSQKGILYNMFSHVRKFRDVNERAYQLLDMVFLVNKANEMAVNLTHGEKRKLEIAMLLALETEMLLLDEPTAGMSLEEVPMILDVIRNIRDQRNRTILLIEHKIDMVLDLSDNIMVLFHGQLLADGPPKEIIRNEQVQSAYLGGLYNDAS